MGGGGGKGGGKGGGGGVQIDPEMEDLIRRQADIAEEQYQLGLPLFQTGAQQGLETLQQGYTPAMLPAIKTSMEQTRSQGSQTLDNLRESATKMGLTGTALQEALAGGRSAVESQTGAVPANFTLPFLQQSIDPALSNVLQGIQGTGAAGQSASSISSPLGDPAAGAMSGAMSGAAMGSTIMPGWGTLIGAGAGAIMGGQSTGAK